jgi:Zn-dependent peptidase ImmA (M78 family)
VNVVELAQAMGFNVDVWDMPAQVLHEISTRGNIAVSPELDDRDRRWAVAHGIAHASMHERGNHVWLKLHTFLHDKFEREAEEFAYGLLVNKEEAWAEGLRSVEEMAYYFGVPAEKLWLQGRLL